MQLRDYRVNKNKAFNDKFMTCQPKQGWSTTIKIVKRTDLRQIAVVSFVSIHPVAHKDIYDALQYTRKLSKENPDVNYFVEEDEDHRYVLSIYIDSKCLIDYSYRFQIIYVHLPGAYAARISHSMLC